MRETRKNSRKSSKKAGMTVGDWKFSKRNLWLAFCRFEPTFWKMKARQKFHISRKPLVPLAENEESHDLGYGLGLRLPGSPRLLAVARDPSTVFAYWDVDWPSIFKNATPVDRRVHLRIHCADGVEEKEAAVEPMAGMHYFTLSQRHRSCLLEIGYYQPADVWHSVVKSNEVLMPPQKISESEDVDIATIPFHIRFQQLIDLLEPPTQAQLAVVVSEFEKQVLDSGDPSSLSAKQKMFLRKLGWSGSSIAAAWRGFDRTETDQLAWRTAGLLGSFVTSPIRGFGDSSWSSGG